MGANSETEHQDVLELFLRNDDHDLHSSPGNMDYSGEARDTDGAEEGLGEKPEGSPLARPRHR